MTTKLITINKEDNWIECKLKALDDKFKFKNFIDLNVPLTQKAMEHPLAIDPRDCVQALKELQNIHKCIKIATENLGDPEQALAQYCLAGLFQLHFVRCHLDSQEVWQCRLPWLHLLRIKYHALAKLIRQGKLVQLGANSSPVLNGLQFGVALCETDLFKQGLYIYNSIKIAVFNL